MTSPIGFTGTLFNQTKIQQSLSRPSNWSSPTSQVNQNASTSVTLSSSQTLTKLKEKYNVMDMSNRDLTIFSEALAKNGFISNFEAATLSLVVVPPGARYNPDARVNILNQTQNQLEFSKQYNPIEQTQSLSHVLNVLKALQR